LETSQVSIKQEPEPEKALLFDRESSSAPGHMAIQPLDHFKRGYQERADFRDRETNQLVTDFESPPSDMPYHLSGTPKSLKTEHFEESDTRQQSYHKQHHHQQQHRSKQRQHPRDHPSNGSSAVFDVVQLVDHLCHQGCNLVETLDRAKDNFSSSFLSGKALTAILSNLARRRKMGIALSVWEWMDERRIEKNVYHYNSLISVCEKVKDYQRALRLLEEMEHRGIPKNEVTYVLFVFFKISFPVSHFDKIQVFLCHLSL
jgi:pentatricopeptide repeat protein